MINSFSKDPKNTEKIHWTDHAKYKMKHYGLSAQKILGVIRRPERKEEGIVKNTVAVMQPVCPKILKNKKIWKQEIWAVYQNKIKNAKSKNQKIGSGNSQIRIISAWRYPGISPKRNPVPEEILREIADFGED